MKLCMKGSWGFRTTGRYELSTLASKMVLLGPGQVNEFKVSTSWRVSAAVANSDNITQGHSDNLGCAWGQNECLGSE